VRLLHRKSEREPVPECECGGIGKSRKVTQGVQGRKKRISQETYSATVQTLHLAKICTVVIDNLY